MIVCIGEILADMIGKKKGNMIEYSAYAGGAPFNVACGVARLGGNVSFCGRVGKDEVGKFLLGYGNGVSGLNASIVTDGTRNTTLAFVTLDESGERSFAFARKHTADYAFTLQEVESQLEQADIVHLGSLMLSEEEGRAFAEALYARVKQLKKKLSFDVNYRDDIFESGEVAKSIYGKWLDRADILKLSEDEVTLFFGADESKLYALSEGRKIFVTLGKKGSVLYENGVKSSAETIKVTPVDTTGAGDGFYAGALAQIDGGEQNPERILRIANICGALATEKYGAIDGLPTKEEVQNRL